MKDRFELAAVAAAAVREGVGAAGRIVLLKSAFEIATTKLKIFNGESLKRRIKIKSQ